MNQTLADVIIKIFMFLLQRSMQAIVVLALFVPIMLLLVSGVYNSTTATASRTLLKIVLFPSFLQGKEQLNNADLITAFVAWSIIFFVIGWLVKILSKGKIKFPSGNISLIILYVTLYIICAICLPFMDVINKDYAGMYSVLGIFFLIGFVPLVLLALVSFVLTKLFAASDS